MLGAKEGDKLAMKSLVSSLDEASSLFIHVLISVPYRRLRRRHNHYWKVNQTTLGVYTLTALSNCKQ